MYGQEGFRQAGAGAADLRWWERRAGRMQACIKAKGSLRARLTRMDSMYCRTEATSLPCTPHHHLNSMLHLLCCSRQLFACLSGSLRHKRV